MIKWHTFIILFGLLIKFWKEMYNTDFQSSAVACFEAYDLH